MNMVEASHPLLGEPKLMFSPFSGGSKGAWMTWSVSD